MKPESTPRERFEGWYKASVEKLRELPDGDGAISVLMIAFPWYERAIKGRLKLAGSKTTEEAFRLAVMDDLKISEIEFKIFWDAYRNGVLHQAMPKDGKTKWSIDSKFLAYPVISQSENGERVIQIDPFKFADHVAAMFDSDDRLVDISESYPLARIFSL